ncbi:MAG: hypothetical protein ACLSFA_04630 [Roseburia inulinivorans]
MHELYDINISGSNVESALGYNQSNADDLLRQIYEKLPSSEAVVGKMDQGWNTGGRYLRNREHKSRSCDGEME